MGGAGDEGTGSQPDVKHEDGARLDAEHLAGHWLQTQRLLGNKAAHDGGVTQFVKHDRKSSGHPDTGPSGGGGGGGVAR